MAAGLSVVMIFAILKPSSALARTDTASDIKRVSAAYCPIPNHQPDFADEQKYYPVSKYAAFPARVRCLMQYAYIEGDICKGSFHGRLTERACRRGERAMVLLERTGWCWDSKTGIDADDEWMECSVSPGYAYRHSLPTKHEYDIPDVPNRATIRSERQGPTPPPQTPFPTQTK